MQKALFASLFKSDLDFNGLCYTRWASSSLRLREYYLFPAFLSLPVKVNHTSSIAQKL